jgi:hypothetical protein
MQVLNLENKQSQLPADAVTVELFNAIPGRQAGRSPARRRCA